MQWGYFCGIIEWELFTCQDYEQHHVCCKEIPLWKDKTPDASSTVKQPPKPIGLKPNEKNLLCLLSQEVREELICEEDVYKENQTELTKCLNYRNVQILQDIISEL